MENIRHQLDENFRSRFNNKFRFPEGKVRRTIFPTTAYKQLSCKNEYGYYSKGIATLTIPAGSTVVRAINSDGKLRSDEVYVEKIEDLDGNIIDDSYQCVGAVRRKPVYKTGSVIKPSKPLNTNINDICVQGIHFFLSKEKARKY
ncbi:hypothetical protein QLL95_gp0007 [Cotonvirus japonicus]|uniref:Uncharacterized protein n=1 Tax=Cotonvirus japonicus TaxID=2811091 RepID=A0ABM7NQX1_9VIRU|nr:hypothetical protein QLL95_gp0007 [Cotonvirus japonicus]BCS82496.1 hypothetical protein [Cotonvirus japonicus]